MEFRENRAVVGRDAGVELPYGNGEVSRRHAEFYRDDEALWVRDLNSTNGTYVDGVKVGSEEWTQLHHHSSVSLGRDPENLLSFGTSQAGKHSDPRFEATAGHGVALKLPAEGSEFVWGRAEDADHKFSPELGVISRRHLAVRQNAGAFWVKDLGSSYGTFLGGSKEPLKPQQWVEVPSGSKVSLAGVLDLNFAPKAGQETTSPHPMASMKLPELGTLSPEQSRNILARAQVASSPVGRPMNVPDLTPEFLSEQGFEPRTSLDFGDTKLHFSKPYQHAGRDSVVGYVEKSDGSVSVRSFYRSSSHGLWKVASHGGYGGWFGKGVSQESVTLPLAVQKGLGRHTGAPEAADESTAQKLFYGALEVGGAIPPASFGETVAEDTLNLRAGSEAPTEIAISDSSSAPDFASKPAEFVMQSPVHGAMATTVHRSKNGEYDYMFCQDKDGRSWVGGVFAADSNLNSFGVPERFVKAGALTTPALEYNQEAKPAYRGPQVTEDYVDYTGFTHQIPMVKAFLQTRPPGTGV